MRKWDCAWVLTSYIFQYACDSSLPRNPGIQLYIWLCDFPSVLSINSLKRFSQPNYVSVVCTQRIFSERFCSISHGKKEIANLKKKEKNVYIWQKMYRYSLSVGRVSKIPLVFATLWMKGYCLSPMRIYALSGIWILMLEACLYWLWKGLTKDFGKCLPMFYNLFVSTLPQESARWEAYMSNAMCRSCNCLLCRAALADNGGQPECDFPKWPVCLKHDWAWL